MGKGVTPTGRIFIFIFLKFCFTGTWHSSTTNRITIFIFSPYIKFINDFYPTMRGKYFVKIIYYESDKIKN